jgi:hypothetical protein
LHGLAALRGNCGSGLDIYSGLVQLSLQVVVNRCECESPPDS